ncbi:MAG: type II toxin-antitoxin system HipA family toxin [Sulfuricurvum sp.]|nr:type II toxin-antitoxin system HipA family toxin [Sulfuricurvum sp.]
MTEITAKLYGHTVGTLLYDGRTVYFEYDPIFQKMGLEISPHKLAINSLKGAYTNTDTTYFQGIPGVFHDSLPDKFGMKVIDRYYEEKGKSIADVNLLMRLSYIGSRGMGALEYEPSDQPQFADQKAEIMDLRQMYLDSQVIIKGEQSDALHHIAAFMENAASPGGAQPKASIGWNRETKEIISGAQLGVPQGFEHWLIKFSKSDQLGRALDFTKLEYLYMQMAGEIGISVPQTQMLYDGNDWHYAIKRFDRVEGRKIHMHTLAGLTHIDFNEPGHYSYEQFWRITKALTRDNSVNLEIFKRAVFNVIASNQDDHAKNFSFLMDESGKWNLSPAYDITFANGEKYTANHQMSIGAKLNNFTRKDLIAFGLSLEIKESAVKEIIQQTIEVLSSFSQRAKEIEIRDDLIRLVETGLRLTM